MDKIQINLNSNSVPKEIIYSEHPIVNFSYLGNHYSAAIKSGEFHYTSYEDFLNEVRIFLTSSIPSLSSAPNLQEFIKVCFTQYYDEEIPEFIHKIRNF